MSKQLGLYFFLTIAVHLSLAIGLVWADGYIEKDGKVVRRIGKPDSKVCEKSDLECSNTILRLLSGINFGHTELSGGWISVKDNNETGSLKIEAVSAELPIGDMHLGQFEFAFVPGLDAIRLRFTLGKSEVLFTCKDSKGQFHAPAFGRAMHKCRPDVSAGIGGEALSLQWDQDTGRFIGKWAELNGVVNLIGSPHSMEYLRRHLNVRFGLDAESFWYGDARDGSDHLSRGVLGFSGLVRSASSKWEANGDIVFRPVLFGTIDSFSEYGAEGSLNLLYNFLNGPTSVVSAGVQMNANYWSDPLHSMGSFVTGDDNFSMYIGGVVGVRYGYTSF